MCLKDIVEAMEVAEDFTTLIKAVDDKNEQLTVLPKLHRPTDSALKDRLERMEEVRP